MTSQIKGGEHKKKHAATTDRWAVTALRSPLTLDVCSIVHTIPGVQDVCVGVQYSSQNRTVIQFQPLGEEFAEKHHTENAFKGLE